MNNVCKGLIYIYYDVYKKFGSYSVIFNYSLHHTILSQLSCIIPLHQISKIDNFLKSW